jgi:hypothetical protein
VRLYLADKENFDIALARQELLQMKVYLASAPGEPTRNMSLGQIAEGAMKVYLVSAGGNTAGNHSLGTLAQGRALRVLLSYFYFKQIVLDEVYAELFEGDPPDTFLDSGAFSAESQGVPVDIAEYCAYIKRYEKQITVYANLDVIGDPEGTRRNQEYMEAEGLHPLPVFHVGEPWHYLESYIERYPYIALGGLVPFLKKEHRPQVMRWLLKAFRLAQGKSVFHGFGCTAWEVVCAFPWYSVDSSAWGTGFRFGKLPLFNPRKGSFELAYLGDHESCYRHAALFRQMGFDPADFADRTRNSRQKICALAVLSYQRSEEYLERKHGPVTLPERISLS